MGTGWETDLHCRHSCLKYHLIIWQNQPSMVYQGADLNTLFLLKEQTSTAGNNEDSTRDTVTRRWISVSSVHVVRRRDILPWQKGHYSVEEGTFFNGRRDILRWQADVNHIWHRDSFGQLRIRDTIFWRSWSGVTQLRCAAFWPINTVIDTSRLP